MAPQVVDTKQEAARASGTRLPIGSSLVNRDKGQKDQERALAAMGLFQPMLEDPALGENIQAYQQSEQQQRTKEEHIESIRRLLREVIGLDNERIEVLIEQLRAVYDDPAINDLVKRIMEASSQAEAEAIAYEFLREAGEDHDSARKGVNIFMLFVEVFGLNSMEVSSEMKAGGVLALKVENSRLQAVRQNLSALADEIRNQGSGDKSMGGTTMMLIMIGASLLLPAGGALAKGVANQFVQKAATKIGTEVATQAAAKAGQQVMQEAIKQATQEAAKNVTLNLAQKAAVATAAVAPVGAWVGGTVGAELTLGEKNKMRLDYVPDANKQMERTNRQLALQQEAQLASNAIGQTTQLELGQADNNIKNAHDYNQAANRVQDKTMGLKRR